MPWPRSSRGVPRSSSSRSCWGVALQEVAACIPYVPGQKVISNDEQGDPLYEDVGLTPRLVELTRRYRRALETATTAS